MMVDVDDYEFVDVAVNTDDGEDADDFHSMNYNVHLFDYYNFVLVHNVVVDNDIEYAGVVVVLYCYILLCCCCDGCCSCCSC